MARVGNLFIKIKADASQAVAALRRLRWAFLDFQFALWVREQPFLLKPVMRLEYMLWKLIRPFFDRD